MVKPSRSFEKKPKQAQRNGPQNSTAVPPKTKNAKFVAATRAAPKKGK
jgi:hypothetical protein